MNGHLRRLVVMVKAPLAGRVKSRLAREVGAGEAVRFYRTATAALLRRLGADPRWHTSLAVTPDGAAGMPFWPATLARFGQGGGDLGMRMQRVLDRAGPGPVVIIGSDIPAIRSSHIAAAFAALGPADVVFGPATDGGYWLVGAKRLPRVPQLFDTVRWSSPDTLADTLGNIAGLKVAFVERLSDVDDGKDYRAWRRG